MLNFYRFRQDYLKFEGNDRLDLVNRLSTNQVNTLQQYSGIKTVLTNDKGRIVDLITLYNFGDFVFSLCSLNNAENVLAHLDKYTIMDDFKPVNMAGTHETILFYGDEALKFAHDIFGSDIGNMVNNDFSIFKSAAGDAIVSRNDNNFGGFMLIYPAEDKNFWDDFLFAGAVTSGMELSETSDEQFETERVVKGVPSHGKEMSELTNPLECGLNEYVSFTKGCYIGQEVIARMDAYDKISKHMVKIESEKPFNHADKIITDGKECGFVTSSVKISENKYAGLGFVKTIFLNFDKSCQLKQGSLLIECKILKPEK